MLGRRLDRTAEDGRFDWEEGLLEAVKERLCWELE